MTKRKRFRRPERRFLVSEGTDAVSWWQGQATNDVAVPPGQPVAFCLVTPTGQLEAVVDGRRTETGYLLVTERPEVLLDRVRHFVILEDVSVRLIDGTVVTEVGASCDSEWAVPVPDGCDVLGEGGEPEDELLADRLAKGIPDPLRDATDRTLPPELGTWFDRRYVHYAKGCYTGQEVLQRIHSRGHVNRIWSPFRAGEVVPVASPVLDEAGNRVGAVTQCRIHPQWGPIVGAYVKRGANLDQLTCGDVPLWPIPATLDAASAP